MKENETKKFINKRLENHKLESCVLQILLEDYLKILGATLCDYRGSLMRIIILMKSIPVCHPSKNLLIMFTIEKKGWIRHMSKRCTHVPTERFVSSLTTRSIFASFSICTTVAWGTNRCAYKSVDKEGSTVFYRNSFCVLATSRAITKTDHPGNFTIFHCRMSTIQPAWRVCTTSECWHTRCWHFCSCSSHKTIPSLGEWVVTQQCFICRCNVTALSIGITQVLIIITWVG